MTATTTPTHCPYCALQCGMHLTAGQGGLTVTGNERFPVNRGALCVKGWTALETLAHPDRLVAPLVRETADKRSPLVPATWDDALDLVARRFGEIQARHGRDTAGV